MTLIDDRTKRLRQRQIDENLLKNRLRARGKKPTQSRFSVMVNSSWFKRPLVVLFVLWSFDLIHLVALIPYSFGLMIFLICTQLLSWPAMISLVVMETLQAIVELVNHSLSGNFAFNIFLIKMASVWNDNVVRLFQTKLSDVKWIIGLVKHNLGFYSILLQLNFYDALLDHFELFEPFYLGVRINYYTRRLFRDLSKIFRTYPRYLITFSIIVASTIIFGFVRRRLARSTAKNHQPLDSTSSITLADLIVDIPVPTIKKKKASPKKSTSLENRAIRRQRKEDTVDESADMDLKERVIVLGGDNSNLTIAEEEPDDDNMPELIDASDTESDDSDG